MLFQVVLVVAVLSSIAITTPVSEPDWTYLDMFQYLVKRGSTSSPTAQLIERHVNVTARDWNEVYQHDIIGPGGAILTVDHSPAGRTLKKRGYPANSITGYLDTTDCHGKVHYTWDNTAEGECIAWWDGIDIIMMNALKVTDFDRGITVTGFAGGGCSGDTATTGVVAHLDECIVASPIHGFAGFSYLYS